MGATSKTSNLVSGAPLLDFDEHRGAALYIVRFSDETNAGTTAEEQIAQQEGGGGRRSERDSGGTKATQTTDATRTHTPPALPH